MPKQTGISFDNDLMDGLRNVRADLQKVTKGRTITNTDIMRYLISLHEEKNVCDNSVKNEINNE